MAELKTQKNDGDVEAFLLQVDPKRQADCRTLLALMREATGAEPALWGDSIIGFGDYHYHYASGREGDWFLTGFAPRKQNLTLYVNTGFADYKPLLEKLGKHKTSVACLYVKKLDDIDLGVLKELVKQSVTHLAENGGCC